VRRSTQTDGSNTSVECDGSSLSKSNATEQAVEGNATGAPVEANATGAPVDRCEVATMGERRRAAMRVRRAGSRWLAPAALLVAGLLLPAVASADPGDPAGAEALFREGRAATEAGDHQKACAKFRESNRLDPAPGTLFNLAACEEKLGHVATAWTLFREVTERLPANDERHKIAAARAAALEPRLPRLTVVLAPGAPEASRVYRGSIELGAGSLDSALPVDPGKHVLAVEAPGRARSERTIEIAEGEAKREELQVGVPMVAGAVADDAAGGSGDTRRTLGFVLGGVGLAGVAVGAVTGVMVLGKKSTVDDECDEQKRCTQTGLDAADAGTTLGTVSGIGFIAGGVLLGAGAVLVWTSGSSKSSDSGSALHLGPGRIAWSGRF
jgi:hypothetical protein